MQQHYQGVILPEVKKRGNEDEIIQRDRNYMLSQSLAAE